MNIDYAFIMCAGKGSRMGKIGSVLPKPLWPVFEKSLLELQIIYAKKLGVRDIFINSHHCHEQMQESLKSLSAKYDNLHLLFEPTLLGSGGGVHNFCRHPKIKYKGTAIYLSGDQFLFYSDDQNEDIKKIYEEKGSCLIANDITGATGYNRILVDDNSLIDIESDYNSKEKSFTFSGMGYLNLELIKPDHGNSSFFDTVCNYKDRKIGIHLLKNQEYWDFGTLNRYFESCFKLFNKTSEDYSFFKVFSKPSVMNSDKCHLVDNSYGFHKMENRLSFEFKYENEDKCLDIIDGKGQRIEFNNIVDDIE